MSLDWMQSAVCVNHDPEIFFPTRVGNGAVAQAREAQAICKTCTKTIECATYAQKLGATSGVWGGVFHSLEHRGRIR